MSRLEEIKARADAAFIEAALAAVRSAMQAKGKDIDNLSADILRRMADELTDTDDRSK